MSAAASSTSDHHAAGPTHPLRPYYHPSDNARPPYVASSASSAVPSAPSSSSSSARAAPLRKPAVQSATVTIARPAHNRYASSPEDLDAARMRSLREWAKAGAVTAFVGYGSTCIAMPFEVAKLLLQVQWVPKDEVWEKYVAEVSETSGLTSSRRWQSAADRGSPVRSHPEQQGTSRDGTTTTYSEGEMAPEAQEWRRAAASDARDYLDSDVSDDSDTDSSSPTDPEAYFQNASEGSSQARSYGGQISRKSKSIRFQRRSRKPQTISHKTKYNRPVVIRGGVAEMMKAVVRGKEGWAGLWKGTFTSFIYDLIASGLQPIISAAISPLIPMSLSTLPLPYVPHPKRTLALLVSSHVVTHLILSPLDLVRTRLIVQSTLPRHRKYSGPWDALKTIVKEEGGWTTLYCHPNILFPALLDLTILPFISLASPLFIERRLRLDANSAPVSYAFVELAISTASLLVSLPIETVRRRLQVQRRPPSAEYLAQLEMKTSQEPPSTPPRRRQQGQLPLQSSLARGGNTASLRGLRTCVETRPKPYAGVVETVYRILTEETSYIHQHHHHHTSHGDTEAGKSKLKQKQRLDVSMGQTAETPDHPLARSEIIAPQRPTYATFGGLRSLYRGFTIAAAANLSVFFLTVVTGERVSSSGGSGGGWAEI